MAKVRFMELVDGVSGKFCKVKPDSPIFQQRKTCNVVYHQHNPSTADPTPEQLAQQQKFAAAVAQVNTIMADNAQVATYREAFAKQTKYKTLRGYIFADVYAA